MVGYTSAQRRYSILFYLYIDETKLHSLTNHTLGALSGHFLTIGGYRCCRVIAIKPAIKRFSTATMGLSTPKMVVGFMVGHVVR